MRALKNFVMGTLAILGIFCILGIGFLAYLVHCIVQVCKRERA